jgi:hypothetical protein
MRTLPRLRSVATRSSFRAMRVFLGCPAPSLGEMAVGNHHGGGSHHKNVCHDLRYQPAWAMGRDEYSRSAPREVDSCPNSRKIERAPPMLGIMHGVLGTSAFSPSGQYEWGPSLHDNNVNPIDVARQQGRWSITPTTLKGMHMFPSFHRRNPNEPAVRCNST